MSGMINRGAPGGKLLISIFFLAFCCLTQNIAVGQVLQPKANPESFNWKSPEAAKTLLIDQVTALSQQLPGLTVGTPLYDNTLRRIAYFKSIVSELLKGTTIAQALELALPAAATLGFEKEASYTPKITLRALQTETRILLTN
ncbi:MAG: hypothetical protein JNJ57_04285 [Saprospiraceae bacterium]|nr:hypothetical protein [Saprospiraceae bacterium]